MEPPQTDSSRKPLWALLAVLLLARAAFVVVLGDVFFYGDEFEKGAAAQAMLGGLGGEVGHHRLAYHYYEGGGFVLSHIDALAFLALGSNLLALKVVALLFNAGVLVLGCGLCRRAFGTRAALIFGLLLVFAPESMQKNSLLALGIHYQALVFVLLVLDLGGRILFEPRTPLRTWAALGLAAGFGTYFSYQCALTVGFVGLALLLRQPRAVFGRRGLAGLGGLALGAAPLAAMWALVGSEITNIHGTSLVGGFVPAERVALLGAFLGSVFDMAHPAALATGVLLVVGTLLGFAALVTGNSGGTGEQAASGDATPRQWGLYLGLYLACFGLVYVCSGFAVGAVSHYFLFHRLSQPWLLAILLTAGGAAAWMRGSAPQRRIAWAVVCGSLLLGALGTARVIGRGNHADLGANLRVLRETKGYRFDEYIAKIWHHLDGEGARRAAQLLQLQDPDPALLDYTLAVNLYGPGEVPLPALAEEITALDPGAEDDWYVGLGPMWRTRYGPSVEIPDRLQRALAEPQLDPARHSATTESFGRFGLGFLVTEDRLREELRLGLEHDLPREYFLGLGYRLYSVRGDRELRGYQRQTNSPFFVDPDRGRAFIERQDPAVREPLREGFERARREHSLR